MPNAIPTSQLASAQPRMMLLHLLGTGVRGEIEVGLAGRSAEQRIADRAADEVELMARGSEERAQLIGDRGHGQQAADGPRRGVVGVIERKAGHEFTSLACAA